MNVFQFSVDKPKNAFTLLHQGDNVSTVWETPQRDRLSIAIVGSTGGALDVGDFFGTLDETNLDGASIKVFYSASIDAIVISHSGLTFLPRSLSATYSGQLVTIWQADGSKKIVNSLPFAQIRNEAGEGFATASATVDYLNEVFNQPSTNYQTFVLEGLI